MGTTIRLLAIAAASALSASCGDGSAPPPPPGREFPPAVPDHPREVPRPERNLPEAPVPSHEASVLPPPSREEVGDGQWLANWIEGRASFAFFSGYHAEYPKSPHRRESEEFEAATKCLRLREDADTAHREKLVAFVADLQGRGAGRDAAVWARAMRVVDWLGDPSIVAILVRDIGRSPPSIEGPALAALAGYASAPRTLRFLTFGGRRWSLRVPASPSADASALLLGRLHSLLWAHGGPGRRSFPVMRGEDRRRLLAIAASALRAQTGSEND